MKPNGIIHFILSSRFRKCIYCGKYKLCEYIKYIYQIERTKQSWVRIIKGYFCKDCQKLSAEDIFTKLKDKRQFRIIDK